MVLTPGDILVGGIAVVYHLRRREDLYHRQTSRTAPDSRDVRVAVCM
jgi:hypothetical protein